MYGVIHQYATFINVCAHICLFLYVPIQHILCYTIHRKVGDFLGISEARKRANDKYLKEKVEEFKVRVPKGKKNKIKAHAETQGESTNAFINRAIDETMERDKAKG